VNAELSAMIPDMAQMHFALHQAVESKMRSHWKRIGRLELKVSGESHEFLPIFLTTRDRLGLEWHGKHFEAGINESVLARIRNAMQ
jgi:hypothetical protein